MIWRIDTTPIASTHYFYIERIQGEAIVCFIKNTSFYFVAIHHSIEVHIFYHYIIILKH